MNHPKYITEQGEATTANDENRLMWYSAGGCYYWTDDWSKLKGLDSIPCCPHCGMVGFQVTVKEWFEGAKKFQSEGNPKYIPFLHKIKERCFAEHKIKSYIVLYNYFIQNNQQLPGDPPLRRG